MKKKSMFFLILSLLLILFGCEDDDYSLDSPESLIYQRNVYFGNSSLWKANPEIMEFTQILAAEDNNITFLNPFFSHDGQWFGYVSNYDYRVNGYGNFRDLYIKEWPEGEYRKGI